MLLSIFLILAFGIVIQYGMKKLPLPGLLGLLFLGVALGPQGFNLLDPLVLDNAQDLRLLALIIILLRAGLGLNRRLLNQVKTAALGLGVIPCIVEGTVVSVAARYLLDFSWPTAASLGFVLAAVSPAVVVPSMLWLKNRGLGMDKGIPVMILAGASVDDVVAITLLSSALGWATGTAAGLYWQALLIPARILGGIALGLAVGWLLLRVIPILTKHNKGYGSMATIAGALAVVLLGDAFNVAGLLAVMALGFVLVEWGGRHADLVVRSVDAAWVVAQMVLFVLIGAVVDIQLALNAGLIGILIIFIGLAGRTVGVLIGLIGSKLNPGERLFCVISYIPKATVQAAVGGLPLAYGVEGGELILAIAVLSIVITAPLGAVIIPMAAPRLLQTAQVPAQKGQKGGGGK